MTSKKLKKHQVQIKCLGGQLSLQQSVKLIVFIEVFFSLVMITQSIDLLTKNGNHFYFLHNFVGYGVHFFVLHVTVCSLCLLTSSLLLLGISKKSRWLLVPHLLWQISYASLSFLLCLILPRLSWRGKIMPPSCIVITTLIAISDEPHDFTSVAFPAYRQVPVTEKIAQDLCGEGTGTRNSTAPSTHHSSTDL
ncbi:hypothetical protein PENTCL1PPCAC_1628 [Pristionchus entomophagus]|uniref:G protein-coupled receptor n=1 Tax=Pristionchus entomophagus TaxID=358040 RepID=A0AAV5SFK2_9BILA|nr:hypothetical protein PENTCL1PPCAC_1628 [Pristionchus entomophagus]